LIRFFGGSTTRSEGILTFWGVRGSIPSPGIQTITFGGNTSCVSVEYEDYIFIFDAGSGIRKLGQHLIEREDIHIIKGSIFLSHMHWDHLQGLPFFTPAFSEENQFTVYGEGRHKLSLPKILEDQMQVPYFPVDMDTLFQAQIKFREVEPKQVVQIEDDITATPFRLTHPNAALGYLLQIQKTRIAYVSDHEHKTGKLSQSVLEMVRGVDVLIHDSQYSREELVKGKRRWGHSAWEDVVDLALESQVKQLFLFHHDPDATDEQLNERQFLAQQLFPNTAVAREGLRVPLSQFVE
jgi:phosphoribosyl 1,2-cyclic phosphodiesterase